MLRAAREYHFGKVYLGLSPGSLSAKVTELEGTEHATDILAAHPELVGQLATWFEDALSENARSAVKSLAR